MTTPDPQYAIKSFKTFRSMEGGGFNATLYRDGNKVALVDDEGNGGPLSFQWVDHAAPAVSRIITHVDKTVPSGQREHTVSLSPEAALLHDYTTAMPASKMFGMELPMDSELFIGNLVEDHQASQKIKKLLKTHLVVVAKGQLRSAKRTPTPAAITAYQAAFPEEEVLNALPEAAAISRALAIMKAEEGIEPEAAPVTKKTTRTRPR